MEVRNTENVKGGDLLDALGMDGRMYKCGSLTRLQDVDIVDLT